MIDLDLESRPKSVSRVIEIEFSTLISYKSFVILYCF